MELHDYTIGWVCALPIETAAAFGMLDEKHDPLPTPSSDNNNYTFGRVGKHNVIIACLPYGVIGKVSAARLAERMIFTFDAIRFILMVGVGGGVPSAEFDIRLGDVVVSKPEWQYGGVIQYDYGMTVQEGRFFRTSSLNRPPDLLLAATAALQARHLVEGHRITLHLREAIQKHPNLATQFVYPGFEHDHLYNLEYDHPKQESNCSHCESTELVNREPRTKEQIAIHHGLIASADQVMKHGHTRENLRRELGILCFEMEAAGLMDAIPCLVIRGICDYSDSHKNYKWQPFAAATASAYAKELLGIIPETKVTNTETAKQTMENSTSLRTEGLQIDQGAQNSRSAAVPVSIERTLTFDPFANSKSSSATIIDSLSSSATETAAVVRYALSSVPYHLDEIKLGCFVLDKKRPNQDWIGPAQNLRHGVDYTWRSQMNFHYFECLPEVSTIASTLRGFFALVSPRNTRPKSDLWSREGRIYELTQPRELFRHMCTRKNVQDWLMNANDDGDYPHFVVGYRTLLDATIGKNAQTQDSSTNDFVKQQKDNIFQLPGERIFAIAFRQIRFRWSQRDQENEAYLAKDTVWLADPLRIGSGEVDATVEAVLEDDGGKESEHVVMVNGSQLERYYIPSHADTDIGPV